MNRYLFGFFLALVTLSCRARAPYEGKNAVELEEMLKSADPAVQAQGAFGLSRLGPEAKAAVPALVRALKSSDTLARQQAALALGRIGPDAGSAVAELSEALNDPEWTVRRQAAQALGLIGTGARSALPALEKLLQGQEKHHLVRQEAQKALAAIQE